MSAKKAAIIPTPDQFKQLQKDLRELDLKWVSALMLRIAEDESVEEDLKNELTERKIYNVFNGIVKDGKWKMLIFTQATAYLDELKVKYHQ